MVLMVTGPGAESESVIATAPLLVEQFTEAGGEVHLDRAVGRAGIDSAAGAGDLDGPIAGMRGDRAGVIIARDAAVGGGQRGVAGEAGERDGAIGGRQLDAGCVGERDVE